MEWIFVWSLYKVEYRYSRELLSGWRWWNDIYEVRLWINEEWFLSTELLILCDVWFNIKCIRLQVDKSSSWYDQRWKLSKNGTYSYNLKL